MLAAHLAHRMEQHLLHPKKTEGGYGPGSWVDTSFTPVPEECERLLVLLALETPGFTKDPRLLEKVKFEGDDLPNIPGPIKAQALTSVLQGMLGIIGHEILDIRGIPTDHKTIINTNMGGLFPGNPALITVDGVDGLKVLQLPTIPHLKTPPGLGRDADFDHYMLGNMLKLRSQAIYPTATKDVWIQLHGSTKPYDALRVLGLDPDQYDDISRDDAYELIKSHTMKYQAKDLELMNIERSQKSLFPSMREVILTTFIRCAFFDSLFAKGME
jgi:hypothetical protein